MIYGAGESGPPPPPFLDGNVGIVNDIGLAVVAGSRQGVAIRLGSIG